MSTAPEMLVAGVNASVPSALMLTVPSAGLASVAAVTVSVSPSTSSSLDSTGMDASVVLIAVDARSSAATGASLTGVTLMVVPALTVTVPSETV